MRVNDDVINVLDGGLNIQGTNVVLLEQLDRKLYTAVNKVLEACGGKWNRKAKAHVFDSDPTDLLQAVVDSGEVMTARDIGFFETPVELARALVADVHVRRGDVCLEPSAGTGRIVTALFEAGASRVHAFEIDERRSLALAEREGANLKSVLVTNVDFMSVAVLDPQPDRVVMNPPFCKVGLGNHLDHVQHAFEMLKPGGELISVLPISIKHRNDKRHAAFRTWYEGLGGEVEDLSPEAFRESGTLVRTCTLLIRKAS
jgi:predicted RNA methylase